MVKTKTLWNNWKDAANWVCKAMGLGVSAEQNDPANLLYGMKR
jgi:hypothetical protein